MAKATSACAHVQRLREQLAVAVGDANERCVLLEGSDGVFGIKRRHPHGAAEVSGGGKRLFDGIGVERGAGGAV